MTNAHILALLGFAIVAAVAGRVIWRELHP